MVGLGEIGFPIFRLIKKSFPVIGFDKNKELIPKSKKTMDEYDTRFLHICIPFGDEFSHEITRLIDKFVPLGIVIHSTVSPNTTSQLQKSVNLPILKNDTNNVIEFNSGFNEEINETKPRNFWNLLKMSFIDDTLVAFVMPIT